MEMKYLIIILFPFLYSLAFSQSHTKEELVYIREVNILRANPQAYLAYVIDDAKNDSVLMKIVETELVPLMDTLSPLPLLEVSNTVRQSLEKFDGKIDSASLWVYHGDFKWV